MPVDLVAHAESVQWRCQEIHGELAALYRAMPSAALKAQVTAVRLKFCEMLAEQNQLKEACREVQSGARPAAREIPVEELELHPSRRLVPDRRTLAANDHTTTQEE